MVICCSCPSHVQYRYLSLSLYLKSTLPTRSISSLYITSPVKVNCKNWNFKICHIRFLINSREKIENVKNSISSRVYYSCQVQNLFSESLILDIFKHQSMVGMLEISFWILIATHLLNYRLIVGKPLHLIVTITLTHNCHYYDTRGL